MCMRYAVAGLVYRGLQYKAGDHDIAGCMLLLSVLLRAFIVPLPGVCQHGSSCCQLAGRTSLD
jgi:hypothetical protein